MGQEPPVDSPFAALRGLDKTMAAVTAFTVKTGSAAAFGPLTVTVQQCQRGPGGVVPQDAAWLEISEGGAMLFAGWMFAAAPAYAALDHPVFDIWLERCLAGPPLTDDLSGRFTLPDHPPLPPPTPPGR